MKKIFIYTTLFSIFFITLYGYSQVLPRAGRNSVPIETADNFMEKVSKKYSEFKDFQANINIFKQQEKSKGVLYSKPPNKLRINFTVPLGQIISSDGEDFYVYIPQQNVVLYQKKNKGTSTGSFVSSSGLNLLLTKYIVSYEDKPRFVSVKIGLQMMPVMKIKLQWRSPSQSFREMILFIGRDLLLYRVDAITYNRTNVKFVFSNIQVNKGIPDARFVYDPPATAHLVEDFLFEGKK